MGEMTVGVRDLKAHLSEYLRRVQQGQVLIITDHGRPVGRLLPAEQPVEERLKVLLEAGMAAWNGEKLRPLPQLAVNRGERQASDILVEMRQ
jgi:prevent-host-death family protein